MRGHIEAKVKHDNVSGTLSGIHFVMEKADPRDVEDPAASQNVLFRQVGPVACTPHSLQRFTPLLQPPRHHHLKVPPHPSLPLVNSFL